MPERPLNRRVRAWALWSLPPPARAYLLALDAAAAVLLVAAAASEPVTERYWIRAGVLVALAIAYVEVAGRVQRLTSYLGTGGIGSNHRSVWTAAALVLLPPGWAAAVMAVIYAHALVWAWPDRAARPHRLVSRPPPRCWAH